MTLQYIQPINCRLIWRHTLGQKMGNGWAQAKISMKLIYRQREVKWDSPATSCFLSFKSCYLNLARLQEHKLNNNNKKSNNNLQSLKYPFCLLGHIPYLGMETDSCKWTIKEISKFPHTETLKHPTIKYFSDEHRRQTENVC